MKPFDLEAAKRGEPICYKMQDSSGIVLKPVLFIGLMPHLGRYGDGNVVFVTTDNDGIHHDAPSFICMPDDGDRMLRPEIPPGRLFIYTGKRPEHPDDPPTGELIYYRDFRTMQP